MLKKLLVAFLLFSNGAFADTDYNYTKMPRSVWIDMEGTSLKEMRDDLIRISEDNEWSTLNLKNVIIAGVKGKAVVDASSLKTAELSEDSTSSHKTKNYNGWELNKDNFSVSYKDVEYSLSEGVFRVDSNLCHTLKVNGTSYFDNAIKAAFRSNRGRIYVTCYSNNSKATFEASGLKALLFDLDNGKLDTNEELGVIKEDYSYNETGSGGSCAENGSCYGDYSSGTGRSKTNHVSGYYRTDGTYVRGHYRS